MVLDSESLALTESKNNYFIKIGGTKKTNFDYSWLFLIIFDYFWLFLIIVDYFWLFLIIVDYFLAQSKSFLVLKKTTVRTPVAPAVFANSPLIFFQKPNLLKIWIFLESLDRNLSEK
jgi:hypothetical protein